MKHGLQVCSVCDNIYQAVERQKIKLELYYYIHGKDSVHEYLYMRIFKLRRGGRVR